MMETSVSLPVASWFEKHLEITSSQIIQYKTFWGGERYFHKLSPRYLGKWHLDILNVFSFVGEAI